MNYISPHKGFNYKTLSLTGYLRESGRCILTPNHFHDNHPQHIDTPQPVHSFHYIIGQRLNVI